ncbi:MAG: relaxase/mobilization nuclease domain-containing protein [Candidatus Thiodiazotropha endolucinida]
MILQGSQRGGAKNLALHLLKDENEHVEVHELRGFVADDLVSALNEAHAISRGTKAKQFLFSLSLNPPRNENVSTQDFEEAIGRVEEKLGLSGQPRAIVFHEKQGRRHAHAVWSRIDTEKMKAIPLPYTSYKLRDVSRELYIEHGWQMPPGYMDSSRRDPRNFTLAQWQQAKRTGKDPREIKAVMQDCWAISDTQGAFRQALKERGFVLARGDRRGFVALDHRCEVYSVSKWVGLKAKAVRARLTDKEALPSVDQAKAQIAKDMGAHLTALQKQQETAIHSRLSEIEQKRIRMMQAQRLERQALRKTQQTRWLAETRLRQERFNKGLRGLLDRVTGHYRRIRQHNERETRLAQERDRREKDNLIFDQLGQRRALQTRMERLKTFKENRRQVISGDIELYKDVQAGKREVVDFRQKVLSRQHRAPERER